MDAKATSCSFERFNAKGDVIPRRQAGGSAKAQTKTVPGVPPPYIDYDYIDTVELTWDQTYGDNNWAYQSISTRWKVPPAPKVDDDQTIYFFPAFQGSSILQPVLGWWQGEWTIASWNCCSDNNAVWYSSEVTVNPGDEIYGSVSNNCADGGTPCPTWNIVTADLDTGVSTVLGETPIDSSAPNWVLPANLEVYSIYSCRDYPPDGELTFHDIKIYDKDNLLIRKPKYDYLGPTNPSDSPQCNYGWKQQPNGDLTLTYGQTKNGNDHGRSKNPPKSPVHRR